MSIGGTSREKKKHTIGRESRAAVVCVDPAHLYGQVFVCGVSLIKILSLQQFVLRGVGDL